MSATTSAPMSKVVHVLDETGVFMNARTVCGKVPGEQWNTRLWPKLEDAWEHNTCRQCNHNRRSHDRFVETKAEEREAARRRAAAEAGVDDPALGRMGS